MLTKITNIANITKTIQTIKYLSAILLATSLFSCTSMSLTGMYKLSQMDPLTADPTQIRVAIKTDNSITVKDGDAQIKFAYTSEDKSISIDDIYYVAIDRNNKVSTYLFDDIKPTDTVTILSLTASDAMKLQQNQRIILNHKNQDKKGTGSLSIGLEDFCLPKPLPSRDLLVDVYLQTNTQDGFFEFLNGIDLKEEAENLDENELSDCS